MNAAIVPENPVRLSPLVQRITQNNPGLLTGPGTNTYLIGERSLLILDPGQNTDPHFEAICAQAEGFETLGVAATHAHPDHWPLAPRIARRLRCDTMGFEPKNGYKPTRLLRDGGMINGTGWTLRTLHTPGHSNDHVCFYLSEEKALFTGDHVMDWSTSVIMAPDGNLRRYLSSLERILDLEIAVSYPGHGHPIRDTRRRVEELISHRHMRTRQIVSALHRGLKTIPEVVASVYTDVDPRLHGIARNSVLAHVEAMVESGEVIVVRNKPNPFDSEYSLNHNG